MNFKKTSILVAILFFQTVIFSQEMPFNLGELPSNVTFKLAGTKQIFEKEKTDLYSFKVDQNSYFIKIVTSGFPDVVMVLTNSYGGGELYKKLEDNTYRRIVESRKEDNHFFGLYSIDENNKAKKLVSVENDNNVEALMFGYRLCWTSFKPE